MFLAILESVSQEETVDTHIGHFWWPRIFGLQYCEAKTIEARRKKVGGLSDLKFCIWGVQTISRKISKLFFDISSLKFLGPP